MRPSKRTLGPFKKLLSFAVLLSFSINAFASNCDSNYLQALRKKMANRSFSFQGFSICDDEFFRSALALEIGSNLLTFADPKTGAWPKKIELPRAGDDATYDGFSPMPLNAKIGKATTDNGQTTSQMNFLARLVAAADTQSRRGEIEKISAGFRKALENYIFKAQHSNGGFPQVYPSKGDGYDHFETFNDDSMVHILNLLDDIANSPKFNFVNSDLRALAKMRYQLAYDYVLKAQYRQNGTLSIWAQQYDGFTPTFARSYELPSISPPESTGIIKLLMKNYFNDPRSKIAVDAAVSWLRQNAISGFRDQAPNGQKSCFLDSQAPLIWGRYYDLKKNTLFFAHRGETFGSGEKISTNGVLMGTGGICETWTKYIKDDPERANGYNWFSSSPLQVLQDYEKLTGTIQPPLPPLPPLPPQPILQCQEFDQGKLSVKPDQKKSIDLTCPANWSRRSQRYTGTDSLSCSWKESSNNAKLTCKNNHDKTLDANHVYSTCCY